MYNQERSVVYQGIGGNPMDTYWQMRQYQDKQALLKLEQDKEKQQRDDSLMKWAAEKLDFTNFATGTQLDPVINTSLDNLLKDVAGKIKSNPSLSMADLVYNIQDGVGRVSAYSQKAKNIRAGAEKMIGEWSKNPSIDGARLMKGALTSAFMKVDPQTGQLVPKNPEEIDERTDYVSSYLQSKPEDVITGTQYLYDTLGKLKGTKVGDVVQETDARKGMNKFKYSGEVMPWQTIAFERGKDGYNRAVPKVKTQEVDVPGIGKMAVLDEGVYGQIFGDKANDLILEAQVNKIDPKRQLTPQQRSYLKRGLGAELVGGANIGGGIVNENVEKEQPIKVTVNTGSGSGSDNTVNNMYERMMGLAKMARPGKGVNVNALGQDEQKYLVDIANSVGTKPSSGFNSLFGGNTRSFTNADIYLKETNGVLGLYDYKTNQRISVIDKVGTNMKATPGLKNDESVIRKGNTRSNLYNASAAKDKKKGNSDPLGIL